MHLQKQKNSRTFETQNQVEKSIFNFLTQNKAQAIRCKSCNFWYPAGSAATWAIIYKISSNMQNQKKTLHKTKASTPPITKVESRGNKPSKKLSLQNSKNSRTFEARYTLEQSKSIFLNQNKAQATCESQVYPSVLRRVSQRPEPILKQLKNMRYTKKTSHKTKLLTRPTIKVEPKNNKPSRKISLQNSKNSRTFEVQTEAKQFTSTFLTQNKAQAIGCKSFNFRSFGSVCSDLGFYFTIKKSHANREKHPPCSPEYPILHPRSTGYQSRM